MLNRTGPWTVKILPRHVTNLKCLAILFVIFSVLTAGVNLGRKKSGVQTSSSGGVHTGVEH